jgi:phage terminase large subunit
MIRQALRKVGVYMYCLPTFRQAKLVIFDSITNDGRRFLDFIPRELIKSTNSQELKVVLTNGSIIQFIGSDSYDTSLVGTNPRMVIMSEYALADPRAYHYIRPILNANGGTMMILSTPRGKNHLWDLYNIASNNPSEWFCSKLTLDDTQHISWEEIKKEIYSGEISEDLAHQEYFCSFEIGIEGSIFAKHIDIMRLNNQIGQVPWESAYPVNTVWDIGRDRTAIIFFQLIGQTVRIIDCYAETGKELPYYARFLDTKPYKYGKHYVPHDGSNIEWAGGLSRFATGRQLGIKFETRDGGRLSAIPKLPIETGLEYARICLAKTWIDEDRCKDLIKSLESYRYELNTARKIYSLKPVHDINSHFADSFRYLATIVAMNKGAQTTAEELERRYLQTVEAQEQMPGFFRDDRWQY